MVVEAVDAAIQGQEDHVASRRGELLKVLVLWNVPRNGFLERQTVAHLPTSH